VKGKYFQPITSIAPKLTTTTEIDVDSFKIGTFHELVHDSGFSEVFVQLQYIAVLWCAPCHIDFGNNTHSRATGFVSIVILIFSFVFFREGSRIISVDNE
jgi:hypothetical protein